MKHLSFILAFVLFLAACSPGANQQTSYQNNYDQDRCKQLSDEVEALKGKPIRRNAAYEYYLAECVNN